MKLIGRHPFTVAFVAIGLTLAYFILARALAPDVQEEGRRGDIPAVVIQPAGMREFVDTIQALGTTYANESVAITAKVTEKVSRINFKDGDFVKGGDTIVELTDDEELAQLAEDQATLEEAQKQLKRVQDLVKRGNAAQTTLDSQLSLVDQAKARVAGDQVLLSDRVIKAPFSGRLGLRQVSVGTLVTPGTVITTLDEINLLKLDFTIPELYLDSIKAGQQVIAQNAAYPDMKFEGKVTAIDTRIDPVTRSVTVRASLPNNDGSLRPGMLMTINVTRSRNKVLAVPETAISNLGAHQYVYLLGPDGTAVQREVTIGRRIPGYAEITTGLKQGDPVIAELTDNMRDGERVRVLENDAAGAVQASQAASRNPIRG